MGKIEGYGATEGAMEFCAEAVGGTEWALVGL